MNIGTFLIGSVVGAMIYYYYKNYFSKNKSTKTYVDDLETVKDLPEDDTVPMIVLFKSELCAGCKTFKDEWKKATNLINKCQNRPNCIVIDVDHMGAKATNLAKENNITHIPSITLLKPDSVPIQIKSRNAVDIYDEVKVFLDETN